MPWLALLGVLAGVIVGFAVWFILRMIPTRTFAAMLDIDLAAVQPPEDKQPDEQPKETADNAEQSDDKKTPR